MKDVLDFLSSLHGMPTEQLVGLIALVALGLAVFALYVVLRIVTRESGK